MKRLITDSPEFIAMPLSSQALYFHLLQRSDECGYVGNHEKVIATIQSDNAWLDILIERKYVLECEDGVIVLTNRLIHAYIVGNPSEFKLANVRANSDKAVRKVVRGERLPTDAELSKEWICEALKVRPQWDMSKVQTVFDSFKDYWTSKTGSDATKLTWIAAWRNWCRNERSNPQSSNMKPVNKGHVMDDASFNRWLQDGKNGQLS
jgi:hypothetical protein